MEADPILNVLSSLLTDFEQISKKSAIIRDNELK